jgi:uncharacterized membrane protein
VLYSLLLPVHITGGILGILSGAAAMSFRKGSPRHALAGKVFVASMLTTAAAAVYLATVKHQTPNIIAGILTFYLVTTAWLTARRGDGETSRFDWGVLLIPLAGASWGWFTGWKRSSAERRQMTRDLLRQLKLDSIRGNMERETGVPVPHKAVTASSGHSGGSFRTVRLAALNLRAGHLRLSS